MEIIYLLIGLFLGIGVLLLYNRTLQKYANQTLQDKEALAQETERLKTDVLELNRQIASSKAHIEDRDNQLVQLDEKFQKSQTERESYAHRVVELISDNKSLLEKLETQKGEIEQMKAQMNNEFKLMAEAILEEKTKKFTEVNNENIGRILLPLQEKLTEFKTKVEETYDKESKERFSLDARIRELVELNQKISQEANNLTKALKGDNKTQGDWGEMILENILQLSGLRNGREYFTQETLSDESGKTILSETGRKMRPDVIVMYPDKRKVIIDSKVSLTAYSRYVAADEKEEINAALSEHVRSVKSHINELAAKEYQEHVDALDFVMMFVANEPAYLVAMQHDGELWQYAYSKRVLLVSPTTLIASLKLIADLWKRELQNQNALDIANRGAALYDKFVLFTESMNDIRQNLERTMKSCEEADKRLKGNGGLISQADKMRKLGLKTKKNLPPVSSIEENSEEGESE